MIYRVRRALSPPRMGDEWCIDDWSTAEIAQVDQFHPRSSDHRPVTRASVLYYDRALYVNFQVHDRYVRAAHTGYQAPVCRDSCVEFFVQPLAGKGYFNFEFNCGGALLLYYIEDPTRTADAPFTRFQPVSPDLAGGVRIHTSLPPRVEPEIRDDVNWSLSCAIPLSLLEAYTGRLEPKLGDRWRGNFFKCGDETSHPHWASWSPIGETLRFHQPDKFGELQFSV